MIEMNISNLALCKGIWKVESRKSQLTVTQLRVCTFATHETLLERAKCIFVSKGKNIQNQLTMSTTELNSTNPILKSYVSLHEGNFSIITLLFSIRQELCGLLEKKTKIVMRTRKNNMFWNNKNRVLVQKEDLRVGVGFCVED